ncbi:multisubunit potassium/proton antiporter, PhaA subunit /multisubunit potassium/proton antiporter, PhaB subunit [Nitrosomonas cryotolerans]|uniref:Multisubunit potassium/proton antiporter, PhaA subunit /multisubunit potassium/proton antiporter, PhaB subunit n=1 Tax=Nitrosomonas cryotolerans ATCC 49181 TaxID=1131553 RepID=A0A1N6GQ63_9PROT|nr:monovalent cation/H+ antiporter subunit A [Nitrosomonas cryotolerans]SFP39607.1 multisubunit potassium/proton antiporter, PhaA subunit /multisubunit potassium/proton antiporter, PhaB subunit [Nitrosomonas cryotolerans]SIO09638.1 multisubunit potassium/proton antiporter, PhaA subunit /multisubunit potassium/proton antiporter, PhaB subunit [Nitrosomonas cryotolerans ATCC 49181]
MNLLLIVLTPFIGAIFVAWISRLGRLHAAWAAGAVTLTSLIILLPLITDTFSGYTLIQRLSWIPLSGLDIAFRLDGLSLLFALLILGIGLLIILYARYYLSERDDMGRFYAYLLLFMGSMLGIALSENIIQLLIFWELTSLSSFLLISYWQHRSESRIGARMALAVTGGGGLALLGGFLLLGQITGSYDLAVILVSADTIHAHPLYLPMLILVLLGAFTKSAQFPFHFWLPNAMAAPTPVSAYLHSATMVKAGVFLLARLFPALSGTPEWFWLVSMTGLTTLLLAAYIAMFKHDLKGLLAYSTISHLGLITLLFGIGTPIAAVAGVFHIINHAIFKASLFMAAGIIDHETGTRDMRRLSGLWKFMPHTALLAMVAAASMAGVPLFNGFLSKEMFFAETWHVINQPWGWLLPTAATIAGVFAVAYSLRFIHNVFFQGEPVDLPRTPHEPPRWMKVPVEILVALCLLVGIFPALTVEPILAIAAASVLQGPLPEHNLAIWHGFNPALWMSVIALIGGGLIYLGRQPLFILHERMEGRLELKSLYHYLLETLFKCAKTVSRLLDAQSLQQMLFIFITFIVILGALGYLDSPTTLTGERILLPVDGVSLVIALILMIAALGTVILHQQRLTALILMGMAGLGVALIFVKFSAPDLALTQLSVEVVTIVLLLLALYFLPQQSPSESSQWRRGRDWIIAIAAGSSVTILVWAILTRPYQSIADYFITNSVSGGGGTNVVNVILVDFRGYDTLGEITVLALAGLGIYAMLDCLKLPGSSHDSQGRPWDQDMHPVILASFARLLLPLAMLVSIFILLRGHNLPGGGFIAGLITAVALIMQYLANGVTWAQSRLPADMHVVLGSGLFIATCTGLASWLFDYPFLTSTFSHVYWPVIGEFELASAMIFDLGVYLVVVGATLLILVYLGLAHSQDHSFNSRKHTR